MSHPRPNSSYYNETHNHGGMTLYEENLCALVHGEPGVGKSWLAQTMPGPRLIIDAEGGSRHPKRWRNGKVERPQKLLWDPMQDTPPVVEGDVSVQVFCRDFMTMQRTYEYLNSGKHSFRSVAIDSLTEVQKRCKDAISGGETMSERMWGELLIKMELLVRSFRDLAFHPTNPLDAIVILALTQSKNFGKSRPAVQGALGTSLPGYVDLEGYLAVSTTEDGEVVRKMLIQPHDLFEAKDRTHTLTEHYGSVIVNPDIEAMLRVLNEYGD
jgi:AAA domain